ncbi:MAG: nucleoside deaminase [Helicobacteraceae bacterium]|nr:nucleoside deaminase [Helicobacteraceae bacterium]
MYHKKPITQPLSIGGENREAESNGDFRGVKKQPREKSATNEMLVLAAREAQIGMRKGEGGPFGAVIARGGEVIARAHNRVLVSRDPTAHAEICAIRKAARKLRTFDLSGYQLYSSCEPCPMCLGAILWARLDCVIYGSTQSHAAIAGFDDANFYEFLAGKNRSFLKAEYVKNAACEAPFQAWIAKADKTRY